METDQPAIVKPTRSDGALGGRGFQPALMSSYLEEILHWKSKQRPAIDKPTQSDDALGGRGFQPALILSFLEEILH